MTHSDLRVPLSKRVFDILVSIVVLALLSPILVILSLLLLVIQGLPLFFCQDRPGLGGRIFKICKFRTMQNKQSPTGKGCRMKSASPLSADFCAAQVWMNCRNYSM